MLYLYLNLHTYPEGLRLHCFDIAAFGCFYHMRSIWSIISVPQTFKILEQFGLCAFTAGMSNL